jgi:diacylglycerol kinase (ATP)
VVDSVNRPRIAKLFGGQFAFAFHSAKSVIGHRNPAIRLMVDGADDEIATISTVAIANGIYFGGGMKVAPDARPDDGLFDVIVIGGAPRGQTLGSMQMIYTGEHVNAPHVRVLRGHKVVAAPVAETRGQAVLVETDGEPAGRLPASFEILPRAINLRC